MVDVVSVDAEGKDVSRSLTIPATHHKYVKGLLFRRFALALLVVNMRKCPIQSYRLEVVLCQNLKYTDDVWTGCMHASDDHRRIKFSAISGALDDYIATEALVHRHEPVYVSRYRQHRTPGRPNLSQVAVGDVGESFPQHY